MSRAHRDPLLLYGLVKAYRDVQGIAWDAETSEDRGSVLCALHSPRRLSGPAASAQTAQMRDGDTRSAESCYFRV